VRIAGVLLLVLGFMAIAFGLVGTTSPRTLPQMGQTMRRDQHQVSPGAMIPGVISVALGVALVVAGRARPGSNR
jgi:hypothetical protein